MQFAQPTLIIIGIFICLTLYILHHQNEKKRVEKLSRFAAHHLLGKLTQNISTTKRKIKLHLFIGAIFCCFLALARPQYGHHWVDVKRKGIDILFAIDTSRSMLAEDIRPNRLERSKFAIFDFVNQLEGDRVGLLPFAGSPYLMCPLTIDYNAFEQTLRAIDTKVIPTPGTNLAQTITQAEKILNNDANHKFLIIITDGENLTGDVEEAAKADADKNMTIFTVGVGTKSGELIPIRVDKGHSFIKDNKGKFVTSKLDENTLIKIAEITEGLYVPLGAKGEGLETIYKQKLSLIPKESFMEKRHKVPIERFPYPLGLALFLFVLEFLIHERKNSKKSFSVNKWKKAPLLLLPFIFIKPTLSNSSPEEAAYLQNDYLAAAEYYNDALQKDPQNPLLNYNYGTAAYKNNLFEEAITSFNNALKSDDIHLQQKAYFNLGNAQYKRGEETLQAEPQKTVAQWENALESYSGSLQLGPDSSEAKNNYSFVEKRLEELKKQMKNKDKQDTQQNKDQQKQCNNKQNQGQNQKQDKKDSKQKNNEQKQPTENQEGQGEQSTSSPNESQKSQAENATQEEKEVEQKKAATSAEQSEEKGAQSPLIRKMTKEEAEQLLNEMKNEEDALNFIPRQHSDQQDTGRNW